MPVIVAGRIRLPDLAEQALAVGPGRLRRVRPRRDRRPRVGDEGPRGARRARSGRASASSRTAAPHTRLVACAVNARARAGELEWGPPRAGGDEPKRRRRRGRRARRASRPRASLRSRATTSSLYEQDARRSADSCGSRPPARRARSCSTSSSIAERELQRLGVDVRLGTRRDARRRRSPTGRTSSSARPGRRRCRRSSRSTGTRGS